ncbi:hypothetical protein AM588_10000687 [Phytophthora nicotianae]|uniref:Uncharacterized protein n=1 Tax=Phytophthora nicotianae TaxID=4792 RepID=A0A0W8CJU6_PHYNI|nr:hypothetical protein AM588_10000687 [Phytophthora nicotianae]
MQKAPNKRLFPQFLTTRLNPAVSSDVEELSLVELLEADDGPVSLQDTSKLKTNRAVPGAQAYVNRLLVRVKTSAEEMQIRLTPGLTSHSYRRGAAMHANDGSLADNWIIERGGWQLDRVNKAFGYMLGTTQADQKVARVLSGWNPKERARLPSLLVLEQPILARAQQLQTQLFTNTSAFSDSSLNLDVEVAEVLAATLIMHYPDMLVLSDTSAFIVRMREVMAVQAISEAELLAWSATINCVFAPAADTTPSITNASETSAVLDLVKRQSDQISVLILQNKRLEERLLALEAHLRPQTDTATSNVRPSTGNLAAHANAPISTLAPLQSPQAVRSKKKGSQSLSAVWYEWFTSEPRVYATQSIKKTTLYEFRYSVGYMMVLLPDGFVLDTASPAYKSEVLALGVTAQANALAFLMANGSSAVAAGTAVKALRKLHKSGKLDDHIANYHVLFDNGSIIDPTPSSALPAFIRRSPST